MSQVVTVASLVRYLKNKLDADVNLRGLIIKGELSNVKARSANGHVYFTLKDETSGISCVMFASRAAQCKLQLKDGLKVLVSGSVSLYPANGNNQIYVDSIELDGIGAIFQKIEELKRRISTEGLFNEEHKKSLPKYPKTIGVISTMEGAGTQDVFTTLKRRWPVAKIVFYPSLVQGQYAAKNLVARIKEADSDGNDVILLVRGGGSLEDLLCFYDEELIRAIYQMETPIITGVGHETDTTLVDYVADVRANTPTGAAEIATPDYSEVLIHLESEEAKLIRNLKWISDCKHKELESIKKHPYIQNPKLKVIHKEQELGNLETRLNHYVEIYNSKKKSYEVLKQKLVNQSSIIRNERHRLDSLYKDLINDLHLIKQKNTNSLKHYIALLDANSPLKILSKGYAVSYKDDRIIKSVNDVAVDDQVSIEYKDGKVITKVIEKEIK